MSGFKLFPLIAVALVSCAQRDQPDGGAAPSGDELRIREVVEALGDRLTSVSHQAAR